ncbi:hypothetical protein KTG13_11920, partial [Phocaeicola vulgatus]|nr:hypothetical protein [Phocaeicola vulgatus]
MDFNIIDAHSHLWLRQDTEVNGLPIRTLTNGRSLFMGEERQMVKVCQNAHLLFLCTKPRLS